MKVVTKILNCTLQKFIIHPRKNPGYAIVLIFIYVAVLYLKKKHKTFFFIILFEQKLYQSYVKTTYDKS